MRALLLTALIACGALGAGCELFHFGDGTMESPRFRELIDPARPKDARSRLWQDVKEVVNRHWRLKVIDEHEYYVQTEWEEHLGPMYKSGFRRQLNAWVHDDPKAGPWFEVQVLTEVNINIKQPLSHSTADWEDNGRDNRREKAVIYEVETRIRPPGASGSDGKDPDAEKFRPTDPNTENHDDRRKRLWGGG
jgi:hypothetical protein